MKSFLILLLLLGLLSCSRHRASEPFPNLLTPDMEWITYEGILPSEEGRDVLVELQLLPGTPGMDSYYQIRESIFHADQKNRIAMESSSHGRYTVLFGSPGQNIIQIRGRQLARSMRDARILPKDEHINERLDLKSIGDHELVLVDDNFQEVDARYHLMRRSDLFTVEGYFTVYNDTSEYFERNTLKKWPVARFGRYDEAVNNYYSLAKERHEGVYLKALSYSTRRIDKNGNELDALVFKKILQMDSMPALR